jgi:hypothetical protein
MTTMPSKSRSQQRLFQAAAHGATFAKAKALRRSMTSDQLHEFASGSEKGKPERIKRKPSTPHPGGYGARMKAHGH